MRYNRPLKKQFFRRDTTTVARELLGKIIVKTERGRILSGMIVETEAYTGGNDPASHSYNGITKRNYVMFEDGGKAYVYFVYGNHYCFNVVTEKKGTGSAVLIRAVEPLDGTEIMKNRRPKAKDIYNLTNGPGKFCSAFGINKKHNGLELTEGEIILTNSQNKFKILKSGRIGIKEGNKFQYRFFINGNKFVSRHSNNKKATTIQKG